MDAPAAAGASKRPAAYVELDEGVVVAGAAGANDADVLEPVEEGAAAV